MNFKRFLIIFVCVILTLALVSCRDTQKKPLITKNAAISEQLSTVVGGNDYMTEQRSWDDWAERVSDDSTVVLKVKKVSSVSYYWNDENGIGGVTDTTVLLQGVLLGYIDEFDGLEVGKELHLVEPFTVDAEGNTVTPKYSLKGTLPYTGENFEFAINHDERTNPIMEIGEEYIICIWNGWLMSEYGTRYNLECVFPDSAASVVPVELYNSGYLCYDAFEYGEDAYNASSAIVSAYTEKGESREQNSYNLYHAMVKEAFERFAKK